MASTIPVNYQSQTIVQPSTRHVDIYGCTTTNINIINQQQSSESKLLGRIYLPPDEVEAEAMKQVQSMCCHPGCSNIRCMPDCSKGNGCVVGFSAQMTTCVSPQTIGGDIACGIAAIPIPASIVERRNGLQRILNIIHECVPMGSGPSGSQTTAAIRLEQYVPFLEDATTIWRSVSANYLEKFGINLDAHVCRKYAASLPPAGTDTTNTSQLQGDTPGGGKLIAKFQYSLAWLQKRVQDWGITIDPMKVSLVTLGSGNHFIELGQRTFVLDDHSATSVAAKNMTREEKNLQKSKATGKEVSETSKKKGGDGKGNNNGKENNHNDSSSSSSSSSDDEDDDDDLPEYLLSVHTGSRAVGQAIYRHWTKKCAQMQEERKQQLFTAKIIQQQEQFQKLMAANNNNNSTTTTIPKKQQIKNKNNDHDADGDADGAESICSSTSATSSKRKSTTTPGKRLSSKQKTVADQTQTKNQEQEQQEEKSDNNNKNKQETPSKPQQQQQQVDKPQQENIDDDESTINNNNMDIALDPPPAQDDDDETIPFNSGFILTNQEDVACYYLDVIFAQAFATMNRRAILSSIFYSLGDKVKFSERNMIETVHNYIDFKDFIVRKGAIRADSGEKVLIGLNMKEGLWLCRGKGNAEWNNSCAHGCGRIMSRTKAGAHSAAIKNSGKGSNKQRDEDFGGNNKKKSGGFSSREDPRIKQFRQEMGEVVSQTVNVDTYDERPSVYRSSALVRSLIEPSVEVLCRYKTILNAKGGTIQTM